MPRAGADWLFRDTSPGEVFTPERLSDEHRLIEQTATEFVRNEVAPALPAMDKKDWSVARALIQRAGELGLIGVDTPEEFGGVGLDKAAAVIVSDAIGDVASFSATFGAQAGLSLIPILCFGTADQKQKYLPRIVSGEIIGAYCLSESGSGSDALSARARATKLADGSWSLTGEKLWITNGGFADVFIVFAKIDGEHFSAFIVERRFPGVSTGKEEHKMGLHGSSTTPLILQDARVPAENLLGEAGKGHKIAFNVLNYGRFKLAAMCTGGARAAIAEATQYALTRRQFDRPISEFGAIRHKLAEMTVRLYAVESALFRTAGLIDERIAGSHDGRTMAAALEEFAIEASLLKIASSEMTDYVVDENVQIHGGNGFVTDYPAERRYRDARVNRIFEGTNEINRLVVPGAIIKRGLVSASQEKTFALAMLGLATGKWGDTLQQEQEIMTMLSDLILDTFVAESARLRAAYAASVSHPLAALHADAAEVIVHDAAARSEETTRMLAAWMNADLRPEPRALVNTVAARRRIADAVTAKRGYIFGVRG